MRTKVIFDHYETTPADMADALEAVARKMRSRNSPDVAGPVTDGKGNIIAEVRVTNV
jgi:hypothetical protein